MKKYFQKNPLSGYRTIAVSVTLKSVQVLNFQKRAPAGAGSKHSLELGLKIQNHIILMQQYVSKKIKKLDRYITIYIFDYSDSYILSVTYY